MRKVAKRVEKPVLYQFVGSFNSGKATFAAQLSSRRSEFDIRFTLHMRDNYTLEYARLNPDTMAVPTMEIDDCVCTDSYDMIMYLLDNYPGAGDQEVVKSGKRAEMLKFVDAVKEWDEYMFTYGHMGESSSDTANGIRLVYLRRSLRQVLDEKPEDEAFLTDAYVKKIAGVTNMKRAQVEGEQKQKDLAENIAHLHRVLALGSELLARSGGDGFLFGKELTTADVFFLPIFRIFFVALPTFFDEVWQKHPTLRGYWERALAHPDVEAGLMHYVRKPAMIGAMFGAGVPRLILSWKLGCVNAPELPEGIERRIEEEAEKAWLARS
uniref:GST C-terminal domain-containing protein n=1 Tax=Alexandrium andersonii TaxID=327968 RepID=A0A7S2APA9_9DINO